MPRFTYRQQKIIDSLQSELDAIEKIWPMTANYARIDPFITPYMQAGKYYELIIYHFESNAWFDVAPSDMIINTILQQNQIKVGDIVFDIGSNAGAITVPMAHLCGAAGHVHAFDPYPWNATATKHNAELNGLSNVTAHAVGLSNRDFEISVSPNDARIFAASEAADAQKLKIHDIRRYMNLRPNFLKIDIEGSEHDLFEDKDPAIWSSVERFVLEFHPYWIQPRGIDPKSSLQHIINSGFDLHFHQPDQPRFKVEEFQDYMHLFWGKRI